MTRGLLLVFASLLVLVVGSIWLVSTEAGLRIAWRATVPMLRSLADINMQAEEINGRLLGPLRVKGFSYRDPWVEVLVDEGNIAWQPVQLLTNRVRINEVTANQIRVTLGDATNADSKEDNEESTELSVTVHVDKAEIKKIHFLTSKDSEAWEFSDTRTNVQVLEDRVVISELSTQSMGAEAEVEGFIGWQENLPIAFTANINQKLPDNSRLQSRMEAAGNLRSFNLHLNTEAPYSGDLAMNWRAAPGGYEVSVKGPVEPAPLLVALGKISPKALTSSPVMVDIFGVLDSEKFTAHHLDLTQGASEITAVGHIDWSGAALSLNARANWKNLALPPWEPALFSPSGQASAKGSLSQGEVTVDALYSVVDQQPGQARLLARWQEDKIELKEGLLAAASSRIEAQGRIWPRAKLTWSVNSPNLGELWPGARGNLLGQGELKGDWRMPHVKGKLVGSEIRLPPFELDKLYLNSSFDLENDRKGFLKLNLKGLRHPELWPADLRLNVTGQRSSHNMRLTFKAPQLSGKAAIKGQWAGGSAPWKGRLTSSTFTPQDMGQWQLESPTDLYLHPSQIKLGKLCLKQAPATLCMQAGLEGKTWQSDADLTQFPIALLSPWLPPELNFEGTLNSKARIRGLDGQWQSLNLSGDGQGQISRHNIESSDSLPFKLNHLMLVANPELWRSEIDFRFGDQGLVHVNASAEPQSDEWRTANLLGKLELNLPRLQDLTLIAPEIEQLRGQVKGEIQARGTLGKPVFSGQMALAKGRLDLRDYGISLSPLSASVSGKSGGGLDVDVQATSGEGIIRAQGQITPDFQNPALRMTVKGDRFLANRTDEATVYVSPDLNISVENREVSLTGDLAIPEALIKPGKQVAAVQSVSADQIMVSDEETTAQEPRWKLLAKLKLLLGEKVVFKGMGLETRLAGQLDIRENPGKPAIANGEIRMVDGAYEAYGQKLTLDTGRLIFANASVTEPALDIKASRKPRTGIKVGVRVRGMLDEPEVTLFSTPSMRQAEQLSYLVLGRPLEGNESNPSLASAAIALGLSRGDNIISGLSDTLNVDEIGIESEEGQSSEQASLVVGKYLSPRLYVSYGAGLFESLHRLRMRYRMTDRWTLVGESGTAQGADILYTIER